MSEVKITEHELFYFVTREGGGIRQYRKQPIHVTDDPLTDREETIIALCSNTAILTKKVALCEDEKCPSSVRADKHAQINKAVSDAIGNDGPTFHGSWHDLGEKVAKIVAERDTLRSALESLGVDVDSLEGMK